MADFLNNPFVAPSSNTTEICFKIRAQLFAAHGQAGRPAGPAGIRQAFIRRDPGNTGVMTRPTFEAALAEAGVFLPLYEVNALMRGFAATGAHDINYHNFLKALQLPLTDRRRNLVIKAFKSLDPEGKGSVPLSHTLEVLKSTADTHPEVRSSKLTADQVVADFAAFFDTQQQADITEDAFVRYYAALGELHPLDSVFVSIVERLWRVREEQEADELVTHLALELGEKIRERTKDNETEGEMLTRAFTSMHRTGQPSGKCSREQLGQVLEHCGLNSVDPRIVDLLWDTVKSKYDPANLDGNLLSVSALIDELVPMWEHALRFGGRCEKCAKSPDYLLDEPYAFKY